MPVTSITAIMPRAVFDEMEGFPVGIKLGEDFLLWAKTAMHYPVVFLNEPLAYYNNDVPVNLRATRNLHHPNNHMLFNLEAYLQLLPEGKRVLTSPKSSLNKPTHNPFNLPILNPSLEGRTLDTTEQSPFPSGEGRGEANFAQVWGAHTADSTQYDLLKENAVKNRKNPTEAESVLWDMLKGNKIGYHFRRQHIILDYIVDFICLDKGLIIELDGGYHNDPQQKECDKARTAHLQRLGYTELRFKNEELLCNPDAVIQKIKDTLKSLPGINSLPFREGQGVGSDWQALLDKLRVNGLLEYWISKEYHDVAAQELAKVDWSQQPDSVKRIYKTPIWMLKAKKQVMKWGSAVKQVIIKRIMRRIQYG
jgi:very-short-patch-repair endonuclease